jgi:hypothetical protein
MVVTIFKKKPAETHRPRKAVKDPSVPLCLSHFSIMSGFEH